MRINLTIKSNLKGCYIMFPNGKVQVSALVNKQTKERFDKIKKECPL